MYNSERDEILNVSASNFPMEVSMPPTSSPYLCKWWLISLFNETMQPSKSKPPISIKLKETKNPSVLLSWFWLSMCLFIKKKRCKASLFFIFLNN